MIPRVTIIAPAIYPLGKPGYAGIERLCSLFLKGLVEQGVETSCVCPDGSILPRGVTRLDSGKPRMDFHELGIQSCIQDALDSETVFLDFSHSKWLGRLYPDMQQVGIIWHDPRIMTPPQPKYNVVALSQWQADRFREVYQQGCIVFDPHCVALPEKYNYASVDDLPVDFSILLGKLGPDKGALSALDACARIGETLVLAGPITPGDPPEYVAQVKARCDDKRAFYRGEVTDAEKWTLFLYARCLIYPASYPPGFGEASSHKSIDAIYSGCPVVAYDQGGVHEVIEEGVTGYICPPNDLEALSNAIFQAVKLDRHQVAARGFERWDYQNVVKRWLPLIERVAGGERW